MFFDLGLHTFAWLFSCLCLWLLSSFRSSSHHGFLTAGLLLVNSAALEFAHAGARLCPAAALSSVPSLACYFERWCSSLSIGCFWISCLGKLQAAPSCSGRRLWTSPQGQTLLRTAMLSKLSWLTHSTLYQVGGASCSVPNGCPCNQN